MDLDRKNPIAPVAQHPDHAIQFLDLITACHNFTVDVERVVPRLRDRRLPEDRRAAIHSCIARTRAVLDVLETAMDSSEIGVDEKLIPALPRR
ncbi:DUF6192 family protein [Streptomyces phaeochromogenes]|uniref:DUF6192 family protein n=1 Tax=Streptomyces phaeochromogenes TaxID=1923 RepID=UPI0036AF809A